MSVFPVPVVKVKKALCLDLDIYTDPSDPSVIWNFSILWLRKNIACKFFVLLKTSV